MSKILVTGSSGFIGFHLCMRLLQEGYKVHGIDNMNSFYDIILKQKRLDLLQENKNFSFNLIDISNYSDLNSIFLKEEFLFVFHLAAQAGVRYSFKNPQLYIDSNLTGFINLLESCKASGTQKLFYASSSSVYGDSDKLKLKESDPCSPISLYGFTKKMNEELANNFYKLFNINSVGLRLFTVYGPWGRPDMAPMIFTEAIFQEKEIKVFNKGNMSRDFTYIDDVINPIILLIKKPALPNSEFKKDNPNPSNSWAPYRIFNIGGNKTIKLMNFIYELENLIGKKTKKNLIEMQPGDILNTSADTSLLSNWVDYEPKTSLNEGLKKFINWYKKYYRY